MTPLASIMLLGWFFVGVPALFFLLPKRTAAFSGLVLGWLFLPWGKYKLGPLDIDRNLAVTLSVLICVFFFDPTRFLRYRPSWLDLGMLLWVVAPFFSSLSNDFGAYDGLVGIKNHLVVWGMPYLIGRLYVTDVAALRHMAMIFIFGAILYVPFILWEIRFSPRLHAKLYGFITYEHGSLANRRFGGWRPIVFQRHGLMLGVLMATCTMLAIWLWFTRSVRAMPILPPGMRGKIVQTNPDGRSRRLADAIGPAVVFWPIVLGLVAITVLCKALNGLLLIAFASAALGALRLFHVRIPLALFALVPFLFAGVRIAQQYSDFSFDDRVVGLVARLDADRAGSIAFRFHNEHLLAEKALERPVFGWGGWGNNRVYNENDEDITVTDGYWIIALGQQGLFGLTSCFVAMLGPVLVFLRRYDARTLLTDYAPATGLAVTVCMYMMDCLPNAMLNPMFVMATGGLSGLLVADKARRLPVSRSVATGRFAPLRMRSA